MGVIIETDPFIRRDIMYIFEDNEKRVFEDLRDETSEINAIPNCRYDVVYDQVLDKLTEFINENYTPKK